MHPIIALLAHNFLLASQVICLLRARIITVRQRLFWSIHVSCEMGLPQVRCYSTQLCLWSPSLLTVHQVLGCVLMEDTPIGQFDKCNKFQPKLELGKQTAPSFNYSLCVPDMLTIQLFYHLCFRVIRKISSFIHSHPNVEDFLKESHFGSSWHEMLSLK